MSRPVAVMLMKYAVRYLENSAVLITGSMPLGSFGLRVTEISTLAVSAAKENLNSATCPLSRSGVLGSSVTVARIVT